VDPAATPASRRVEGFDTLPAYVKLMTYGMSCEPTLANDEMVRGQMNLGWCSALTARRVLRQPKCVTHQLMGIMLLAQRRCGDATQLAALTRGLQDRIEDEMSLDIVMRDEYLQRVLMLYWTGVPEQVKPVWLRRVLRAQQPDGSWRYDAQWTTPAPDEPGDVVTGFHATAQGMLIVALALQQAAVQGR
ncbi:MAG TPA: hypothetical protein VJ743_08545, partial [Albitalea sp.]|nr:hypothetical protein [Albitalea sp.]